MAVPYGDQVETESTVVSLKTDPVPPESEGTATDRVSADGRITKVRFFFPPGANGLVDARLYLNSDSIAPSAGFIRGDDESVPVEVDARIRQGDVLTLFAGNADKSHHHDLHADVHVEYHTKNVGELKLQSYASPSRSFRVSGSESGGSDVDPSMSMSRASALSGPSGLSQEQRRERPIVIQRDAGGNPDPSMATVLLGVLAVGLLIALIAIVLSRVDAQGGS